MPAVALLSDLGVPALVRFLRHAGFSTFDKTASHYGLGLTLGNAEVRLDELVGRLRGVRARRRVDVGRTRSRRLSTSTRANARAPCSLVSRAHGVLDHRLLSDPEARAYAFGRGGSLEFPFPVAVKTGTSQAYRDNWTIGYTREVTVGVWVGNFDREPLRSSSGVAGAGPIFHSVMMAAVQRLRGQVTIDDQPLMPAPAGVTRARICALSGMRANEWCPMQATEWVAAEAEALPCSWHHHADEGLLTIWPDRYRTWARAQGLLHDELSRPLCTAASATSAPVPRIRPRRERHEARLGGAAEIANPASDATYLIDPTLRAEFQTLPLRASGVRGGEVDWSIDGVEAGRSSSDTPFHWPLALGHTRSPLATRAAARPKSPSREIARGSRRTAQNRAHAVESSMFPQHISLTRTALVCARARIVRRGAAAFASDPPAELLRVQARPARRSAHHAVSHVAARTRLGARRDPPRAIRETAHARRRRQTSG